VSWAGIELFLLYFLLLVQKNIKQKQKKEEKAEFAIYVVFFCDGIFFLSGQNVSLFFFARILFHKIISFLE